MCSPVLIGGATAAVSGISSVLSFAGGQAAAKANTAAANVGANNTFNDLAARSTQIDAQQSENTVSAIIARMATQGSISASASAFGTSSATAAGLENAAAFDSGRELSVKDLNSQNQRLDVASQGQAAQIRRTSQINSVVAPTGLSLVLGLAGAGLKGTSAYTSAGGRLPGSSPSNAPVGN